MNDPTFEIAAPANWPDIWEVFRTVVASGTTYMFPPDMRQPDARAAWMPAHAARHRTFVARLDGAIVATAILRPNQPGLGDHVANAAWMVHPDAAGRGVGRRFAEYVIEAAQDAGYQAMQFNAVVDTNVRAIRLWESLGFATIGTVPAAFRHAELGPVSVRIMHRSLAVD